MRIVILLALVVASVASAAWAPAEAGMRDNRSPMQTVYQCPKHKQQEALKASLRNAALAKR